MFEVELLRGIVFVAISVLAAYYDLKSRYVPDWVFALGVTLELSLALLTGWSTLASLAFQTFVVYVFLLVALVLWFKVRRRIPFGFGDVKYLTFVASYGGILLSYFSLFGGIALVAAYCLPRLKKRRFSCRLVPLIPFLLGGAIIGVVILNLAEAFRLGI